MRRGSITWPLPPLMTHHVTPASNLKKKNKLKYPTFGKPYGGFELDLQSLHREYV